MEEFARSMDRITKTAQLRDVPTQLEEEECAVLTGQRELSAKSAAMMDAQTNRGKEKYA